MAETAGVASLEGSLASDCERARAPRLGKPEARSVARRSTGAMGGGMVAATLKGMVMTPVDWSMMPALTLVLQSSGL